MGPAFKVLTNMYIPKQLSRSSWDRPITDLTSEFTTFA